MIDYLMSLPVSSWRKLVTCAALYAAVPGLYKPENKDGSATSFRQELTGNDIK